MLSRLQLAAPYGIAVNPATNTIYVANNDYPAQTGATGSISVIDGATNTVTATLAPEDLPTGVAVDQIHNKIYVAIWGTTSVATIDGRTNLAKGSLPIQGGPPV